MKIGFGTLWTAAAWLLWTAATCFAQGYEVATAADGLDRVPDDAQTLELDMSDPAASFATVSLPFRFEYYGERVRSLVVSAHGYVLPDATGGFDDDHDIAGAHGHDPDTNAFPFRAAGASADGIIAVGWRSARHSHAPAISHWVAGETPNRRFVVTWKCAARSMQLRLHERTHRIVLAYAGEPATGAPLSQEFLCGLDEPNGARAITPLGTGRAAGEHAEGSYVLDPRRPVLNPRGIGRQGVTVAWQDVRHESTVPDGCTRRITYLGGGRGYFHVPDRAVEYLSDSGMRRRRRAAFVDALRDEDRVTFGGERGDTTRWVRQVLDGKILLLPANGDPPVRVWMRVIEYFSIDRTGTTKADHHIWNLRRMLSAAFPGDDPRAEIDQYYAWKASARSRLSVGKLFAANQPDDSAKQFDTGRKNEYLLWRSALRSGASGDLLRYETPSDEWRTYYLEEDGERLEQLADDDALRFVADPNYVDGHYEYEIRAPDNAFGWMTARRLPLPPLRDEDIDDDPERVAAPVTTGETE